jgi:3',5'-cyclic AMP phosphodiesterase CpdA
MRRLLALLLVTGVSVPGLALAQPAEPFFIQLADTQFGFFAEDRNFVQESANFEFAIANINRLQPAFVVICGDLINLPGDAAQRDEYLRIAAGLDPSIELYAAAGNHDVGNAPTPESLATYREHFGPDYYSFRNAGIYGIVLNSSLILAPAAVEQEAAAQASWLEQELETARASGADHIVVFQHYSWFIESADEPDAYFNLPRAERERYLALFKAAGVRYIFAGHYHRNAYASDGELEMITSGPVGRPLGPDASGLRLVRIGADRLEHSYVEFGQIPNQFVQAARP